MFPRNSVINLPESGAMATKKIWRFLKIPSYRRGTDRAVNVNAKEPFAVIREGVTKTFCEVAREPNLNTVGKLITLMQMVLIL